MDSWQDGALHAGFEERLDELLAKFLPRWQDPSRPLDPDEAAVSARRRRDKRALLAAQLREQRARAVELAEPLLHAVVHDEDESLNRQLVEPLVEVVGRRRVQTHLIQTVAWGHPHLKVCAVRAWHWSQVTLVYDSDEALLDGRPTAASRLADDRVADLRGWYRAACLEAFVTTEHAPTRDWLARGFLLDEGHYLPDQHHLVIQARAIAEADPGRYLALLTRTEDGTSLASFRSADD
ncbi:hypothetical protein [Catellatospora sp. NPDC049609]|uniref:hypothetical protein n=1 Tax=Catellatospora sp. NPDC049609 TaxID=3155505 RepID=UPI003439F92F